MLTKTIVVHLEDTDLGRARVATAIEMAVRHGAHLTGLFLSLEDFDGDLYGRVIGDVRFCRHLVFHVGEDDAGRLHGARLELLRQCEPAIAEERSARVVPSPSAEDNRRRAVHSS